MADRSFTMNELLEGGACWDGVAWGTMIIGRRIAGTQSEASAMMDKRIADGTAHDTLDLVDDYQNGWMDRIDDPPAEHARRTVKESGDGNGIGTGRYGTPRRGGNGTGTGRYGQPYQDGGNGTGVGRYGHGDVDGNGFSNGKDQAQWVESFT